MTTENNQEETKQEICTITIAFPVVSDDEAISYKKKIGTVIEDIPDARVDFRIMTLGRPVRGVH